MKFVALLLALHLWSVAFAADLKVEVNPRRPVAGEVFQAIFRISSETGEAPDISFSPGNLEVVGKSNQGISTRTVYANGRLTVSREITVVYDLVSQKVGSAFLRDIKVVLGDKTLRHPAMQVEVLKEPESVPEVFLMADVPKKSLYVGEGVAVRYYLYSKVPVNSVDIKRYPKLNKFLKRFLQEPDRSERVSVDGEIYLRTQIYAAKLFPEKAGELKIDPLQLTATYPSIRAGDPFGSFGMGRNFRTKTLSSEAITIQALPLPEPRPANFTGLVGRHEFQLQFGQTKLIVNEPLEVKLTVSGGGALENLEAPTILKHQAFEEFETNGDLKIANAEEATKTFEYTFLARENAKFEPATLTLSYFDPNLEKYVPVDLSMPEIEIAGGGVAKERRETQQKPREEKAVPAEEKSVVPKIELSDPVFERRLDLKAWLPYVNMGLAVLSILIALGWVLRREGPTFTRNKDGIPALFRKGQFSLGEFTKWLSPAIQKTGKSPSAIIRESDLDEATKTYFIDLLRANDYKDYASKKGKLEFQYDSNHFKKLGQYIEGLRNESSSQPS